MKIFPLCFAVSMPLTLLASCGLDRNSGVKGIDTIHSSLRTDPDAAITRFQVLSNLQLPKGILTPFVYSSQVKAEEPVKEFYREIFKINRSESLAGIDGPQQELTVILLVPKESAGIPAGTFQSEVAALQQDLKLKLGLPLSEPLPYFSQVNIEGRHEKWLQDYGEFGAATIAGHEEPVVGLLNLKHDAIDSFTELQKILGLPQLRAADAQADSGTEGGNIEASPEGFPVVGSTIDQKNLKLLTEMSPSNPVVIDTDWLEVGHVDEFGYFIPSDSACGYSYVVGDPIEALESLYAENWDSIGSYGIPRDQLDPPTEQNEYYMFFDQKRLAEKFSKDAIAPFLRDPNPVPGWTSDTVDATKKPEKMDEFINFVTENGYAPSEQVLPGANRIRKEFLVYHNLHIAKILEGNIQKMRAASRCYFDVIKVPALFDWNVDQAMAQEVYSEFPSRAFHGMGFNLNAVVLRNHVIIGKGLWSGIIEDRLGKVLGGKDHVHVIDLFRTIEVDGAGGGSAHCGTNVIRDPKLRFSR